MAHREKRRRLTAAAGSLFAAAAVCILSPGCTTTTIPLTKIPIFVPDLPFRIPFFGKKDLDYSKLGWVDAFDAVHQKLAAEYPFTEHKAIDWAARYEEFAPRISMAEQENNADAYYVALLEYVYSIPDGNMGLYDDEAIRHAHVGGSPGFSVLQLDDGRVVAHVILEDGPAAAIGMQWGAEILDYNGTPIQESLARAPIIWARRPPATPEGRRIEQMRFLTRCPVKTEVAFSFRNPDATETFAASVQAVDDDYVALDRTYLHAGEAGEFGPPIEARILPSGPGYIRIHFFAPSVGVPFPANAFKSEIAGMIRKGVPGLILDLRGNSGGADDLAAKFLGHFFADEVFYEDIAVYDKSDKAFVTRPDGRLRITPRDPLFEGPIAVLVDHAVFNAAEGFVRALQRREDVHVIGVHGTFGSVAVGGGYADLPDGRALYFPVGRVLDAEGAIQGEANAAGEGGITPDLRVPLTFENVRALYAEGEDLLLRYADEALLNPTR